MTFYISTPFRQMRHRMMDNLEREYAVSQRDVYIPVDVKGEDEGYVITAVLPGIQPEEVSIQIVNETVSIQGELKVNYDENDTYLVRERASGTFCRTLTLPDTLDAAKAKADLQNGLLTLYIPKAEEARPKTIKVVSK